LTNENENIPPFSSDSISIALPSVPPLGERPLNVPTPAPAATLTLTEEENKQLKKAQKKALDDVTEKRLIYVATMLKRLLESEVQLLYQFNWTRMAMDVCTIMSLLIILLQPSFKLVLIGKAQSGRESQLSL
jgi:hypothetical protein